MFNEKLKNIFKGKKKTENLIVLIVILIVTVVAINYIWNDKKEDKKTDFENEKEQEKVIQVSNNTGDELENKLEQILKKISGVGNVKVMITYSETSVLKPLYNEDSSISNTNETDSTGGTRTISQSESQKEIIYKENTDGSKEPITQSVSSPKIEGAVVVASGASDANVKTNIIQAIEAATGLATHKIQVFKMEEEQE